MSELARGLLLRTQRRHPGVFFNQLTQIQYEFDQVRAAILVTNLRINVNGGRRSVTAADTPFTLSLHDAVATELTLQGNVRVVPELVLFIRRMGSNEFESSERVVYKSASAC